MSGYKKSLPLLLVIFILVFSALACGGSDDTQVEPTKPPVQDTSESQDSSIEASLSTDKPEPTEPPEPTAIPPTPTTPPIGLSRSNPYPSSELVSVPNWDVKVIEMIRGDDAWTAIQAANMFNDPPPNGMEYILVKLNVKCKYSDSETHSISGCDFDVTGDRLIKYTCGSSLIVEPDPILDAELYTDGEAEGWAGYLVGAEEGNLILIVDEMFSFSDEDMRFIALDEAASIDVPTELKGIDPTESGKERNKPASLDGKVITEDWELSILEVVRGDSAWAMVQEVNQFNDPPEEGMEYVAVKLHVRYIGTEDRSETIDSSYFNSTGNAGVLYDIPIVVDPEPALDAYLFPGGEYEGWVVVQVAKGETGIMLVFEPLFEFSNQNKRFISLE
jgi:hypothetical protein